MPARGIKGVILVALLIYLVSVVSITPMENLTSVQQPNQIIRDFLSADDPILINQSSDFGSYGFTGNGSSSNPFMIEERSVSYDGICLDINSVSGHIVIIDCNFTRLNVASSSDALVVRVDSATNLTIVNSRINNGSLKADACTLVNVRNNNFNRSRKYGIEGNSNSFYISNNTFTGCTYAIASDDDDISEISNNTIIDCTYGVLTMGRKHLVHNNIFIRNRVGISAGYGEFYENLLLNCTIGISASFVNAKIIGNNITNFKETGINLKYMSECQVRRNWISGGEGRDGIIPDLSGDGQITGNTLVNCGINVDEIYNWASLYLVNNTVNGKLLGYFDSATDLVINGSEYGQIILFKCSNTSISNGSFIKTTSGIATLYSTQTRIEDSIFNSCTSGVMTYGSTSHQLKNCNFTLCGIHTQGAWSSLSVENCLVNEKPLTLLKHQDNVTLNSNDHGQIIAYACDNLLISGVSISDASVGITYGHSENGVIEYSNVSSNSVKGIYLANTIDCQVRYCNLTENDIGLYTVSTDNNLITNNTVSQNRIGIRTFGVSNYFYYNTFFDNSEFHAFEGSGANIWDDGVSMGNWWDDYSGTGFYYVDYDFGCLFDGECAEPIDRFPNGNIGDQVPPEITHPNDREAYKDSPFSIHWDSDEDNPDYYYVYVNDSLFRSGTWESPSLSISFTFEVLGTYNITVVLVDWFGNFANDTVFVEVLEAPPTTTTSTSTTTATDTTTSTTNETTTTTLDQTLVMTTSVIISGLVVIVIIAILLRKKSS